MPTFDNRAGAPRSGWRASVIAERRAIIGMQGAGRAAAAGGSVVTGDIT